MKGLNDREYRTRKDMKGLNDREYRTRKEIKGLEIMVNIGQGRILKGKKWQGIQDKKGDGRERNDKGIQNKKGDGREWNDKGIQYKKGDERESNYREYRTRMDMKGQEMTGNTGQV